MYVNVSMMILNILRRELDHCNKHNAVRKDYDNRVHNRDVLLFRKSYAYPILDCNEYT